MSITPSGLRPNRVFLSYAGADREAAQQIATAMRWGQLEVWFDAWELSAGDSIFDRVRDAVSASDVFVILLSAESVRSRWVQHELSVALSEQLRRRAITIISALLSDCEVPTSLRAHHYVDLRHDRDSGISKLVDLIKRAHDLDLSNLPPRAFEELVADLFRVQGYSVERAARAHDPGYDLILTPPGDEGQTENQFVVQVKHYRERRVSVESIRSLVGTLVLRGLHTRGLIVTSGQLTSAAEAVIADLQHGGQVDLQVLDGPALQTELLRHPEVARRHLHRDPGQ